MNLKLLKQKKEKKEKKKKNKNKKKKIFQVENAIQGLKFHSRRFVVYLLSRRHMEGQSVYTCIYDSQRARSIYHTLDVTSIETSVCVCERGFSLRGTDGIKRHYVPD